MLQGVQLGNGKLEMVWPFTGGLILGGLLSLEPACLVCKMDTIAPSLLISQGTSEDLLDGTHLWA